MNNHDERKMSHEKECFDKAIIASKRAHTVTRSFMQNINGEFIDRTKKNPPQKNDSPDLIYKCKDKFGNDLFVGIEHFDVTPPIKRRDGSKIKAIESKIKKTWTNGHGELVESGTVSDRNLIDMLNETIEYSIETASCTYDEFISALKDIAYDHKKKVNQYRDVVKAEADGKKITFGFLMEINATLRMYAYNKNGDVITFKDRPQFTEEFLVVLQNIFADIDVNFIILFFNTDSSKSVVAIKNGDVKTKLRNQRIHIYKHINSHVKLSHRIIKTDHLNVTLDECYEIKPKLTANEFLKMVESVRMAKRHIGKCDILLDGFTHALLECQEHEQIIRLPNDEIKRIVSNNENDAI